ncbi:proline-rich protein 36-like [Scylla paramamosain]|uniref:proline-rich protein 36-like n=1 Tax=Scylla paramamosain TaxID=85552 RepID=UPI003082EC4F
MPRLSDLDLSCNKLGVASLDFLQCTPSLYLLNLSRNALQELPLASLTHRPTLHTLDLSHNNLSSAAALVAALNATASLRQVFLAPATRGVCNRTALLHAARLTGGAPAGGVRAWLVILGVTGVAGGLCCPPGGEGPPTAAAPSALAMAPQGADRQGAKSGAAAPRAARRGGRRPRDLLCVLQEPAGPRGAAPPRGTPGASRSSRSSLPRVDHSPGTRVRARQAVTQERDDEDVSDENLPLTTSAGVATSPTETQTISVAGLRGVRQYTVASWLTLEAPQSSSRPLPEPPAPRDLLAAKIQQRDSSATFTLTRPPPHCPGVTEEHPHRSPSRQQERPPPPASPQSQPFTPVGVSESRGPLTRQRSAPVHQQQQQQQEREQQEQQSPSRPIGQRHQEDRGTSGWAWEAGVCRACLAALSLPDVHSVPLLQHGVTPAWPRGPHAPGPAVAAASPRRGRGHAGYSPFTKTPMSNVSERPVYRSLERGTRRRPLPPPPHPRTLPQDAPHASAPFSRHRSPPPCHEPLSVPSVSLLVQQQESLSHAHKAVLCATRAVPTHSSAVRTPPALPPRQQEIRPATAAPTAPQASQACVTDSGDEEETSISKREAPLVCSRSGGSEDEEDSGSEQGDADIETHATQIIDLAELHGQSPCKPS